jgi:hypothetical protein
MFKVYSKIMHRTGLLIASSVMRRSLDETLPLLNSTALMELLSNGELIGEHYQQKEVVPRRCLPLSELIDIVRIRCSANHQCNQVGLHNEPTSIWRIASESRTTRKLTRCPDLSNVSPSVIIHHMHDYVDEHSVFLLDIVQGDGSS